MDAFLYGNKWQLQNVCRLTFIKLKLSDDKELLWEERNNAAHHKCVIFSLYLLLITAKYNVKFKQHILNNKADKKCCEITSQLKNLNRSFACSGKKQTEVSFKYSNCVLTCIIDKSRAMPNQPIT